MLFPNAKKLLWAVGLPVAVRAFTTSSPSCLHFGVTARAIATVLVPVVHDNQALQVPNKRSLSNQILRMSSSTTADSVDFLCVHVFVSVKPGMEEAFKEASLANARESAKESGIARFDVIQQVDDPTSFVLVEVYKNEDAPAEHKLTAHYNTWRETVTDMMQEPRTAVKYKSLFPATATGWNYGNNKLE